MKLYLSAGEFAGVVQKDPRTIARWVQKGWIPGARRVGRNYRIPSKHVSIYQNADEYPLKEWRK